MAEGTEPWRGGMRDGGRPVRDAAAMARGLQVLCKRRDRAGSRVRQRSCRIRLASRRVVSADFRVGPRRLV